MHGSKGKERDENQKVQKGKEEVVLQPPPEKGASVEVSTLLSSSNLRPLLSSPSLVSEPEALATAKFSLVSKNISENTGQPRAATGLQANRADVSRLRQTPCNSL